MLKMYFVYIYIYTTCIKVFITFSSQLLNIILCFYLLINILGCFKINNHFNIYNIIINHL